MTWRREPYNPAARYPPNVYIDPNGMFVLVPLSGMGSFGRILRRRSV